jgi:hypothetical protein
MENGPRHHSAQPTTTDIPGNAAQGMARNHKPKAACGHESPYDHSNVSDKRPLENFAVIRQLKFQYRGWRPMTMEQLVIGVYLAETQPWKNATALFLSKTLVLVAKMRNKVVHLR